MMLGPSVAHSLLYPRPRSFATEFYENESLFCVAQVYGLYYE